MVLCETFSERAISVRSSPAPLATSRNTSRLRQGTHLDRPGAPPFAPAITAMSETLARFAQAHLGCWPSSMRPYGTMAAWRLAAWWVKMVITSRRISCSGSVS